MDFHSAFEKCVQKFPGLVGLIFVDPDGESILLENPAMEDYDVRLTGAKLAILMQSYQDMAFHRKPVAMELTFENKYIFFHQLIDSYAIAAVGTSAKERLPIKRHLESMARQINQDIV